MTSIVISQFVRDGTICPVKVKIGAYIVEDDATYYTIMFPDETRYRETMVCAGPNLFPHLAPPEWAKEGDLIDAIAELDDYTPPTSVVVIVKMRDWQPVMRFEVLL